MALTKLNNQSISAITAAGLPVLTSDKLPTGSVLNTVHVQSGITYNHNSSADTNTNITAQITPSSTSSKILISATGMCGSAFDTNFGRAMFKKSINGGGYTTVGSEFFYWWQFRPYIRKSNHEEWTYDYMDTPNTTSQITYQLFVRVLDGDDMWWGRWGQDANWTQPTTITR